MAYTVKPVVVGATAVVAMVMGLAPTVVKAAKLVDWIVLAAYVTTCAITHAITHVITRVTMHGHHVSMRASITAVGAAVYLSNQANQSSNVQRR